MRTQNEDDILNLDENSVEDKKHYLPPKLEELDVKNTEANTQGGGTDGMFFS